ncbi:MAG: hypothetical protein A2340_00990 [Lentisphaerae bacterium RIFOXYB12_FULL_60_10]|nr:MAG: hypothetical protein A2340_00990 [Lentisphaerae bacterium RIFOXYB12_FULL_60_10]
MARIHHPALHGAWLKGNTHIHSTASDGGMTTEQITRLYAGAGYDFLFAADHWVNSCPAQPPSSPNGLRWIDGMELDGRDETGAAFHVVCLGKVPAMDRSIGLLPALQKARDAGAFTILAHPYWCGNTFDDVCRIPTDAIEVYNHVCHWINGKGEGESYWHARLAKNPATPAFAVDDAHLSENHPGWNGGWIMVNTPDRSSDAILTAIRERRFYSTTGPQFRSIECRDGHVHLTTSPIQMAWLVGPAWCGRRIGTMTERPLDEVDFKLPDDWPYAYVKIEDAAGRCAWTNPLWSGC